VILRILNCCPLDTELLLLGRLFVAISVIQHSKINTQNSSVLSLRQYYLDQVGGCNLSPASRDGSSAFARSPHRAPLSLHSASRRKVSIISPTAQHYHRFFVPLALHFRRFWSVASRVGDSVDAPPRCIFLLIILLFVQIFAFRRRKKGRRAADWRFYL